MAVFLTGLGQNLSKPIKLFKEKSTSNRVRIVKSLLIAILGFAVLILLPAVGFYRMEDWTLFEGIYYAAITLTTIGFGDYVAGKVAVHTVVRLTQLEQSV